MEMNWHSGSPGAQHLLSTPGRSKPLLSSSSPSLHMLQLVHSRQSMELTWHGGSLAHLPTEAFLLSFGVHIAQSQLQLLYFAEEFCTRHVCKSCMCWLCEPLPI